MNVTHLTRLVISLDNCWFRKKSKRMKKMEQDGVWGVLPYPFKLEYLGKC